MAQNPLLELHERGQSVWLDFLSRDLLRGGGLALRGRAGSYHRDPARRRAATVRGHLHAPAQRRRRRDRGAAILAHLFREHSACRNDEPFSARDPLISVWVVA